MVEPLDPDLLHPVGRLPHRVQPADVRPVRPTSGEEDGAVAGHQLLLLPRDGVVDGLLALLGGVGFPRVLGGRLGGLFLPLPELVFGEEGCDAGRLFVLLRWGEKERFKTCGQKIFLEMQIEYDKREWWKRKNKI